jgi:hypothetical protein
MFSVASQARSSEVNRVEDRDKLLAELVTIRADIASRVPPLQAAVQKDADAHRAVLAENARRERDSLAAWRESQRALSACSNPLEARQDRILMELAGGQCPEILRSAIAYVDSVRDQNRKFIEGDHQPRLLKWCDATRQQLVDWQFIAVEDLESQVAGLMRTEP